MAKRKASFRKYDELRKAKNLTHVEVAKETGISPAMISHWKSGNANAGLDSIIALSDYFGVTVDYFLE